MLRKEESKFEILYGLQVTTGANRLAWPVPILEAAAVLGLRFRVLYY